MNSFFLKLTDTVTIAFPAIIAILGVCGATKVIPVMEGVEQTLMIALGAISTIASIWYNKLNNNTI